MKECDRLGCDERFDDTGRKKYCSDHCRKMAWKARNRATGEGTLLNLAELDPALFDVNYGWVKTGRVSVNVTPKKPPHEIELEALVDPDWVAALDDLANRIAPSGHAPVGVGPARTVMLLLGDTQAGKAAGGGLATLVEEFTPRLIEEWCLTVADQLARGPVERIILNLLGDLIEGCGLTGPGLGHHWELEEPRLVAQVQAMVRVVLLAIKTLRARFPDIQVEVIAVPGNHGRTNASVKGLSHPFDNWDIGVPMLAAMHFEDDPMVTFNIPEDSEYTVVEPHGYRILSHHGHNVNGGQRALANTIKQVERLQSGRLFGLLDAYVTGHHHQFWVVNVQGVLTVGNGAADGGSPWFTNRSGIWQPPAQAMLSIVEGEGIEMVGAVTLTPRQPARLTA